MRIPRLMRFICVANSKKMSGRCIAGKRVLPPYYGTWIRPVSGRQNNEISEDERMYEDGNSASVLDVIDMPFRGPSVHPFQTENVLIDDTFHWDRIGSATYVDLLALLDNVRGPLWHNNSSSYNGHNDRIDETQAANASNQFGGSLKLIHVQRVIISVALEGAGFPNAKRRVRGSFTFNGILYKLSVTDPTYERIYLQRENGNYEIHDAILCISVGEPFNGFAYKLIAAIHLRTV